MKMKCEVVRDLLPLYVDGVVSEESRKMIEEHLEECADCREYCRLLQEDLPIETEPEYADEAAVLKKIKRRMFLNRLLIVAVTLAFAVVVGAVIYGMNLTEYEGTLEENVSYELPEGYVEAETTLDDADDKTYVRETADKLETIEMYYDGLEKSENSIVDKTVQLDDETELGVGVLDWDNSYDNELEYTIHHGDETYYLTYQCQETDKDKYYSSCSKEQQNEMMGFIKTFDYHRPDGSDMNAFQRLYRNFGAGGIVVLVLTLLFFIGIPVAIGIGGLMASKGDDSKDGEAVISSRDLHDSMNRERAAKGESSMPSINTVQGVSSNTLARRDHSWSSLPDFFIKMFRRK